MSDGTPLWNLAPAAQLAVLGLIVAVAPLAWVAWRYRHGSGYERLRGLTLVTLFLTFDLVLFGAFTRLTDSGLGCPDWPGCYGSASPLGAATQIDAAQTAMPTGPVTTGKAWIEMIHRYLASGVGVLILTMTVAAWVLHRRAREDKAHPERLSAPSPWWPTFTLVWVCAQGAFGALTVTMKLFPAIVTLHLLGGLGLLALLALQAEAWRRGAGRTASEKAHADGPRGASQDVASVPFTTPRARIALWVMAGLCVWQMALGGWVSTNYAVLACTDFPTCHGRWWPVMDFAEGFALWRPLGLNAGGLPLEMDALTAIHYTHRLMAYAVLAALLAAAAYCWRLGEPMGEPSAERSAPRPDPAVDRTSSQRWALFFLGVAVWQLATGVSNVVLGWPLLAAVSHTGGAAVLVAGLATLWMRGRQAGLRTI